MCPGDGLRPPDASQRPPLQRASGRRLPLCPLVLREAAPTLTGLVRPGLQPKHPISPANAGAQIHPGRFGWARHTALPALR
ncbi:hypothetical protein CA606_20335 [Caulobacter vibrioides]|uniref:Uncharacterized protein n=1 Tax=Caulobacter vibrioides TaxID=155892 RepID=A0A2S1B7N2_CAUVI|nr:hypothetical protein CA606_20335 [Caulobacter vibrioides]